MHQRCVSGQVGHDPGDLHRFDPAAVRNCYQAATRGTAAYAAFFHAMPARAVHLLPSTDEPWFLSAAHEEEALGVVLEAVPHVAQAVAAVARTTRSGRDHALTCDDVRAA